MIHLNAKQNISITYDFYELDMHIIHENSAHIYVQFMQRYCKYDILIYHDDIAGHGIHALF